MSGLIRDVELEMLLSIRKKNLWPIEKAAKDYAEDDLFDVMEFLFQHVSKPIEGRFHSHAECGMHWDTFNREEGRAVYRSKMNEQLTHHEERFELSGTGDVLHRPEAGFENIFDADVPSQDKDVVSRIDAAVRRYRRPVDDRRPSTGRSRPGGCP